MNKHEEPRRPISVEELLRVKKSERPSSEFWGAWQGQMHSRVRDVAATKRSWWKDALPRLGITVARWHVVVGATALASLVIVAIEEYQPALSSLPVAAATASANDSSLARKSSVPAVRVTGSGSVAMVQMPRRELRAYAPGELSSAVAMILTPERGAPVHRVEARLGSSLQASLGLEQPLPTSVAMTSLRMEQEKVASMKQPSEARRSHYLRYTYNPSDRSDMVAANHSIGPLPSRLNDDELYETASSRIGARGDRVSLRF